MYVNWDKDMSSLWDGVWLCAFGCWACEKKVTGSNLWVTTGLLNRALNLQELAAPAFCTLYMYIAT